MKHKLAANSYEPFPLTFKPSTVYQGRLAFLLCGILGKKKKLQVIYVQNESSFFSIASFIQIVYPPNTLQTSIIWESVKNKLQGTREKTSFHACVKFVWCLFLEALYALHYDFTSSNLAHFIMHLVLKLYVWHSGLLQHLMDPHSPQTSLLICKASTQCACTHKISVMENFWIQCY